MVRDRSCAAPFETLGGKPRCPNTDSALGSGFNSRRLHQALSTVATGGVSRFLITGFGSRVPACKLLNLHLMSAANVETARPVASPTTVVRHTTGLRAVVAD